MSQGTVYQLKHPVELRNTKGDVLESITEVQLRRMNGKNMRDIANAKDKGSGETLTAMVCACAAIPRSTFDQLDAEDTTEIANIAAGFIGGALATGET